jgi:hypothetical protein
MIKVGQLRVSKSQPIGAELDHAWTPFPVRTMNVGGSSLRSRRAGQRRHHDRLGKALRVVLTPASELEKGFPSLVDQGRAVSLVVPCRTPCPFCPPGKSSAIRGNQALIKRNQTALTSAKSFIINEIAENLPKRTFEYCTHPCHWTGGNLSREERLNACSSGPRSFSPKPPNKVSPSPYPLQTRKNQNGASATSAGLLLNMRSLRPREWVSRAAHSG